MQTQNTFGNYTFLLLIIGFLCLNTTLQAQDLLSGILTGPEFAPAAQLELIDPMCSDPACGNFVNCETKSYVELGMNPLTDPSINYDAGVYQITVDFSVEYTLNVPDPMTGNTTETINHALTVEFNRDGGTFINKDWILLDGGYDIEVIITEVTLNPPIGSTIINPTPAQLPVEAFLRIGSKTNRFFPLIQTTPSNVEVDYAPGSSAAQPYFIQFDWNEIPGAETYDLEWTWLDNETSLLDGNISYELDFNLKFDATRINTTASSYEIPNAYREGILIARVRGVGKVDDCEVYVQGDWSVADKGIVILNDDREPIACNFCFKVEAHREKMNWQHSRTYAEEGKHKDVISYFDGSLRSRQTVTRLESDDHAIVAESYYDHVGRAVANALPVPAINGDAYDRRIDFYDNFNQTTGLQPFNRQAFETKVDGEDCNVSTPEMSSTSGSSLYFSPQNPLQEDHQAYVPDANGYPYTQTIYTQDNTGRVRVQGGVGPDHKLGEHDTKYFYGIPEQQELDRLFGNNVGYHQYYKKNMVVDANNQVSISYLDNKQRVIATALAGDSVAALIALPSFHDAENQNLISSDLHELNEPSDQVGRNSELTINKSLLVSEERIYNFDYELTPQDFTDACAPDICFDCAYEVKMVIYDDCNQPVDTREVKSIIDLNNTTVDGACDDTNDPLTFSMDVTLDIGNYNITKVLGLDGNAMDKYEELYVDAYTCTETKVDIFTDILNDLEFSGCVNPTCLMMCQSEIPAVDFGNDLEAYIEALKTCLDDKITTNPEVCALPQVADINLCENLRMMMISDMRPNGQYGTVRDEQGNMETANLPCTSIYAADNIFGINYQGIDYRDANGNELEIDFNGVPTPVGELSLEDFMNYEEDFWIEFMLPFHPEYGHLEWCEQGDPDGSNFDNDFLSADQEEAVARGFFNPLGLDLSEDGLNIEYDIVLAAGNEFIPGAFPNCRTSTCSSEFNALTYKMEHYILFTDENDEVIADYSIWDISYLLALSNVLDIRAILIHLFTQGFPPRGGWDEEFGEYLCNSDRFWQIFKGLYIELKKEQVTDIKSDFIANFYDHLDNQNLPTCYPLDSEVFGSTDTHCGCDNWEVIMQRVYDDGNSDEFSNTMEELEDAQAAYDLAYDNVLATYSEPYTAEQLAEAEAAGLAAVAAMTEFEIDASLDMQCDSICYSYREQWRAELAGCGLDDDGPEMELLLADLVELCSEGCDVSHPLGARNTESGDSFEQVINMHVSSIDDTCNDLLLTVPPSYNTDVFAGSQPIFDDCVCDRYTQIYSEYENSTSGFTDFDGFYDYLKLEYDVNFSSDEIIDLDCACRNQGMIDPAFLLETPFGTNQIPAPFSCVACLDCDQMNALVDRFFVEINDLIISETSLTPELIQTPTFRPIFRNWLNQELGFNLSLSEYIDFIDYCRNTTDISSMMGMMGGNQNIPDIPQQFNRAFVQRSVIAGKSTGNNTLTSTNANLDFTISTIQPTTTAGDQVDYNIIITNTGNQAISFDYLGTLPGGWSFNNNPMDLFGGTIIPPNPTNPNQLEISGMTLPAGEEVDWDLTVQVPLDIYLAKNYYHQGSLTEANGDITFSDDPATTEEADPTGIFLEVPNPCQGNVETEEDMVLFLTELKTAVGNNPSYPVIIPFNNLTSLSNNSSLNLWTDRAIENLSVQIPDPALTGNELTILFTYDCSAVEILCALTLDGITSLTQINEVTGAEALGAVNLYGDFILQIDLIDVQNTARSILAVSGCFDLTPCEKRQLCNRSVTFPGEPVDDCLDYILDLAVLEATTEFETLIDDSREKFRYEYALQCMNTGDILTQEFTTREYHHTLYYYDQSGNLIRTIPPKGVAYLSSNNIDNIDELQKVKDFRDDVPDATAVYPTHGMRTTYEYNTFNQIWRQKSIDTRIRTLLFYDKLGRVVASQDGRQYGYYWHSDPRAHRYSYTLYDELGRITEVGEIIREPVNGVKAPNMSAAIAIDPVKLQNWLDWEGNIRVDVVRTIYDSNLSDTGIDIDTYFDQPRRYLRKRVSSSLYYDVYTPGNNGNYSHGTHYDYDIHGNVKTLIQEFPSLHNIGEDLKRIDYSYDLLSGNVNQVNYQAGDADAFYHRYGYDADNRITSVETSKDQLIWDEDATYQYYDHGPLARTELGEHKVQGCDYTYTIHGWIKGVNSNTLVETRDPGKDGAVGHIHNLLAADAYGYSLGYYSGDYEATTDLSTNNNIDNFLATESSDVQALDLFNGNIRSMITAITKPDGATVDNLPSVYQYDQLHRIKSMQKYAAINPADNSWGTSQPVDAYQTSYQYDPNGNIDRLTRRDENNMIDNLTYGYEGATNRLDKVKDAVTAVTVGDLKGQGNNNYGYDWSGNLRRDISNRINFIEWNVQGKVHSISRYNNTNLADLPEMVYRYDPMGNRIVKITRKGTNPEDISYTYYVRDASGNVMSVYNGKNPTEDNQEEMTELYQKESHLYGSARLGIKKSDISGVNLSGYDRPIGLTQRNAGQRFYELSNHLGNVLTTVSDNKLLAYQGNALPLYRAEVISYNDYYPFGWEMPGRQGSTAAYRYGFNGKEKDEDGEFGAITNYDYGFRIYNPAIGKFLSVDPLTSSYPFYTPYQFAGNKPIWASDLDGLEPNYSTNDTNGDTQTTNGVDYEYKDGDWNISALGLSYKDATSALGSVAGTLRNLFNENNIPADSYIGGKFLIKGVPVNAQLYANGKIRLYKGGSKSVSPGGFTAVGVDGQIGVEANISDASIRGYSEGTLSFAGIQLELNKTYGNDLKFTSYFGIEWGNDKFSINYRGVDDFVGATKSISSSLNPEIARRNYLQGFLDRNAKPKIGQVSERTIEVKYKIVKYLVHRQTEYFLENWYNSKTMEYEERYIPHVKTYHFREGSLQYKNMIGNGTGQTIIEKVERDY